MCPFNDAMKAFGGASKNVTMDKTTITTTTATEDNDIVYENQAKPTVISILFSTASYAYMFVVFVFTFLFTFIAPKRIGSYLPFTVFDYNVDQNSSDVATLPAILMNASLLIVFGFFHSLLSRESVKKIMEIPTTMERPLFVLQSAVCVHLLMHFWQGFESPLLWSIRGKAEYALMALQVFGILFLLTATFALDHFHLFGLSQGFGMDLNKLFHLSSGKNENELSVRWHYALVAHPLMTGILMAFWFVPRMTGSRFMLAAMFTTYILFAVKYLEEPQIHAMIGAEYTEYLKRVPRYIPFIRPAIAADLEEPSSQYAIGESPSSVLLPATMTTPLGSKQFNSYGNISV